MSAESKNQFAFSLPAAQNYLFTVADKISVEAILIFWFALTPLASFYLRFPAEQSLITFDRLIFCGSPLLLAFKAWRYKQTANHKGAGGAGLQTPDFRLRTFTVTKFELVWFWLSLLALVNALLMANSVGYGTRIAIDAFFLPLVAFHLARYHFDLRGHENALFMAILLLVFFLFFTGVYEFISSVNLFPYKGSELMRERELRINGAFASDSSFAIICLLIALFLRIAPRLLGIKLDKSARAIYFLALAAITVVTLLPFFRATILALGICWLIIEILMHFKREPVADEKINPRITVSLLNALRSHRALAYAGLAVVVLTLGAALIEMQSQSSIVRRLSSPRNFYGRLATWQTAARIALENPLFGVGMANYTDYFEEKFSDLKQEEDWVGGIIALNSPHSNFLWVTTELGLVALTLYLLAYGYLILMGYRALKHARNKPQWLAAGFFLVLLIAYTLPGLTLSSGAYSDLNLYFFFLLGLTSSQFN
jgi:O-antigen ligase